MSVLAYQITENSTVYSSVCVGLNQRKHQIPCYWQFEGNPPMTWSAPSHYLNQCWHIVNGTLRKFQWNLNQNSHIIFQENAFENIVWIMAAILSRPQCVENCTGYMKTSCFRLEPLTLTPVDDSGVLSQKQVSKAGQVITSTDIVGCNYLFMPLIPASDTGLLDN